MARPKKVKTEEIKILKKRGRKPKAMLQTPEQSKIYLTNLQKLLIEMIARETKKQAFECLNEAIIAYSGKKLNESLMKEIRP